ncbi:MAG: protease IV [Elusimicrobia bacterium]|nr:MAG: protease IV [Elusimicrobiota bacterium]KAF0155109.1 MAG: protease IV [Elusimicrobiota bacterium]
MEEIKNPFPEPENRPQEGAASEGDTIRHGVPVPSGAPPPPAQAEPAKTATRLWLKVLAVLYAGAIMVSFLVIEKAATARKSRPADLDLKKITGMVPSTKDAVAVVPVYGGIYQGNSPHAWDKGSGQIARKIDKLAARKEVKAILLDINSPGGTVSAVQEINAAILRARNEHKKPVVAVLGDVAASGGYYIAAACDKVVAHPGTITGSIGVIFSGANVEGLMKKIGYRPEVIKSGKFKDIGSMGREMTPEERRLLQAMIDDSYDQFVEVVSTGRNIPPEKLRAEIADGRIYTGRQALEVRLVDVLGDTQTALDLAGELGKLGKNPRVIRDTDPFSSIFSLLGSRLGIFGGGRVSELITDHPRLEYRWQGF